MTDPTESEQTLATTARWIAAVRARENEREDGLVRDPWAGKLAGAEGERWLADRPDTPAVAIISIRARFFDEFVQAAVRDGVSQVVLVAAGLDTRAFRLSWPTGTRLFEIDRMPLLAAKDSVLSAAGAEPKCERRVVGADLATGWTHPLVEAGFARERSAFWLLEGILFYLQNEVVTRVLDEVTSLSAPGSSMGFDIANAATLTSPYTRAWLEMQARLGAPWLGTLDDPAATLAERGWQAEVVQPGDPQANFGRWPFPILPLTMSGMPRHWLVTAHKGP
jgi:methyltransferase (TIGR00027 family)